MDEARRAASSAAGDYVRWLVEGPEKWPDYDPEQFYAACVEYAKTTPEGRAWAFRLAADRLASDGRWRAPIVRLLQFADREEGEGSE